MAIFWRWEGRGRERERRGGFGDGGGGGEGEREVEKEREGGVVLVLVVVFRVLFLLQRGERRAERWDPRAGGFAVVVGWRRGARERGRLVRCCWRISRCGGNSGSVVVVSINQWCSIRRRDESTYVCVHVRGGETGKVGQERVVEEQRGDRKGDKCCRLRRTIQSMTTLSYLPTYRNNPHLISISNLTVSATTISTSTSITAKTTHAYLPFIFSFLHSLQQQQWW
ncbi:hypothetical protein BC567DRAFT_39541 [Phyllosticta citribraziliensis]